MSALKFPQYASIILDLAVNRPLDYGVDESMMQQIRRGMRVEVPVRGKLRRGYVYELKESSDVPKVKGIARLLSDTELVSEELFRLAVWMAGYYCTPLSKILQILVPATLRKDTQHKQQLFVTRAVTREAMADLCAKLRAESSPQALILDVMLKVKKGILLTELLEQAEVSRSPLDTLCKKGILAVSPVKVDRSPLDQEEYLKTTAKKLTEEQEQAFIKICKSLDENRYETHLLFGVTGSGKTEVYLQAIDHALAQGKGAIMLVPEIALTAQTIERFRSRFDSRIAVLHHRLSHGERFDEWHRIKSGEAKIVVGARSAIFSPVQNLGLLIVDEEHESSYKQTDEAPCYHARDVAVMRSYQTNATVILGSATPALESYHNAMVGKYTLSTIEQRADNASMPSVEIVDMRVEFEKVKGYTTFSDKLLAAIKKRQSLGEQTILFLNRRGYHTMQMCKNCAAAVKCPHCDLSLTFHLKDNVLACHLCAFQLPPPRQCPSCKSPDTMKFRGIGTEQVERALHAILPEIRTLRMDADTTKHKGSHERLIRDFKAGKADILIGTQMIAKGLHFPMVTLVGILNVDSSLNIPDFRASENVFQLATQVAGRAGRGALAGDVIIQTQMPDNITLRLAATQNYPLFYETEIESRQLFDFPPFSHLVKLTWSGENQQQVLQVAEGFRHQLTQILAAQYEVNPLMPCGYARIKDRYRFQFYIKGPAVLPVNRAIQTLMNELQLPAAVRLSVNVDPTSLF